MTDDEIEMMIILKYGSLYEALRVCLTDESRPFSEQERDVIGKRCFPHLHKKDDD